MAPLPAALQQAMDDVFDGLPIRNATELLLAMDSGKTLNERAGNRQETFADVLERNGRGWMRLSEQMIGTPHLKVFAGIGYLRGVEGQRHLVWLGRVLQGRSAEDDQRMAARANDARVTLDIIHTTGVGRGWSWGPASAQNMTEWTGGSYTGVNYADVALARVDARTRFSYLLGYAPTNLMLDGKYRQINVKVNRRDVTVAFQHGYYATGEPAPIDLRELVTTSRLAAAGSAGDGGERIALEVKASPIVVFGRTEMKIDLSIDPKPLSFATTPNSRIATLDVQVFCGDADQKLIGEARRRFDVTVDEETHIRLLRDQLSFSMRVPAAGKVKFVKVVVYDYATDLLGMAQLTLK